MPSNALSLISVDDWSQDKIDFVLKKSAFFKQEFHKKGKISHCVNPEQVRGMVVQLLFAEPSTRTRAGFELACCRLGVACTSLWNLHFSSMAKGETLEDTLQCLVALKPNMIILRCGEFKSAEAFLNKSPVPVVNAGLGAKEHPTQALVDAFTVLETRKKISGEKILIVGDVLHSRVANSNLKLFSRLGAKISVCAPAELLPADKETWKEVHHFESLEEGIKWADVIMCLRVQKERHTLRNIGFSMAQYRDKYRIGHEQMELFKPNGILLHPGPAIRGVEISNEVLLDPRCHILTQVENGSHVRQAVIALILNLEILGA